MSEPLTCPLCHAPPAPLFEKAGYSILECAACRHRFTPPPPAGHVEQVYGDDYFFGGGAGYANYLDGEALLQARGRQYARKLKPLVAPGLLLDVGAAAGFFLQGWIDEGWTGIGVEPNARMAAFARDQRGLDVAAGAFEEWTCDHTFDLVNFVQVLPHFVDPLQAIRKAWSLLKPGGHLLVETWDQGSWTARMQGKGWHEYSPPSVLHWFSKPRLRTLLTKEGWEIVRTGRMPKWIGVGHAASLLKAGGFGSRLAGRMLGALPGRWALPYPSEDLFWLLAKKPDQI